MSSVTSTNQTVDSATEVKEFFDRYFNKQIAFTSNEVDSVIGFFQKRGFEKTSAIAVGTTILQQAKAENKNVFTLLDSLKGLTEVQISNLVAAILNNNRSNISALGFVDQEEKKTTEFRNVVL